MIWITIAIVVALLFAFFRTWRSSESPATVDPSKTAITIRPGKKKDKHDSIPDLADHGDDIEITLVKASPPGDSLPVVPTLDETPSAGTKSTISTVAVTYEDDADAEEVTSPVARILVSAEGQSDQGHVRKRNEDSMLVLSERSLFVVADGMGGYKGGNVASSLAVDTMKFAFEREVFDGRTESSTAVPRRGNEMACAIQMANNAIYEKAQGNEELAKMGTTIVGARFSPNKQRVYIGHVGDSRCYRLRGSTLRQLTSDHTMRSLGMKGPGSGDLFQAVGIGKKIMIDIIVDKPRTDDIYLLCSDGLTKMAKDDQIKEILLNEPDLEAAVYSLIELANDRGGKDNVTVILVKVAEHASLS